MSSRIGSRRAIVNNKSFVGTTVAEQVYYSKGSYGCYAYTYSAAAGSKYASWSINPATFPNGCALNWYAPVVGLGGGVWGYHHIDYGNYDFSPVQTPIASVQVNNLTTAQVTFDFTYAGSPTFTLLHEMWLSTSSHTTGAVSSDAVFEIGFFLHSPASVIAFHNSGTLIGTYTDNGINYTVRSHTATALYITIVKSDNGDVLAGSINWLAAFDWLKTAGVIAGTEWVNGYGFGIEPNIGGGSGTINFNKFTMISS